LLKVIVLKITIRDIETVINIYSFEFVEKKINVLLTK